MDNSYPFESSQEFDQEPCQHYVYKQISKEKSSRVYASVTFFQLKEILKYAYKGWLYVIRVRITVLPINFEFTIAPGPF